MSDSSPQQTTIIASLLTWGGRVVLFALIITQSIFLAAYPAKYEDNSKWYLTAISFAPAVAVWVCLLPFTVLTIGHLFYVWGLYIVALIVNISIVFGIVGDSIDKTKFLGPNVLKVVLCTTPLLLLLLLNTADDSDKTDKHRELVSKLSFLMAIDLFDGIEMIDIVLEEKLEHDIGISKGFGTTMIALACFTLLLSPWQMAENKLTKEGPKIRFHVALFRNIVQMVCVNLTFLVIRAVIFLEYGKDEFTFIAKNGIAIILSILEIRHLSRSRRLAPGSLLILTFH